MKLALVLAGLLVSACAATDAARPAPLEEPLRVLLLGDSISIGYTPFVREALDGRARVVRPTNEAGRPENCCGTNLGVVELERWLALEGGDWDVIHFNFGLHDLKHVDPATGANSRDLGHPRQAEPARYGTQLRAIVVRLGETGARLVFATTTPVPPEAPFRTPGDERLYNDIALRVMREQGVAVDDLFAFVAEHPEPLQRPDDVHFDAAGSRLLGEQVARAILEVAGRAP